MRERVWPGTGQMADRRSPQVACKNPRNHAGIVAVGRKKTPTENSWGFNLVEAAGIEPASASPPPSVLHVYPVYCFNWTPPDRQGKRPASP